MTFSDQFLGGLVVERGEWLVAEPDDGAPRIPGQLGGDGYDFGNLSQPGLNPLGLRLRGQGVAVDVDGLLEFG